MIISVGIMCKKDDMSMEDFRDYLLNVHGPKIQALPEVEAYQQNHVLEMQQFDVASGGQKVDALNMLWFKDHEAMEKCFASPAYQEVIADEQNFVGDLKVVTVEQRQVIPVNKEKTLIKRMSFITRHPAIDFYKFRYEWYVVHADFVKKMEEVQGYRQNLVMERYYPRGRFANRQTVPIDGIVELFFETPELLNQAFSSENGISARWHTQSCINDVTPFLVKEYQLK